MIAKKLLRHHMVKISACFCVFLIIFIDYQIYQVVDKSINQTIKQNNNTNADKTNVIPTQLTQVKSSELNSFESVLIQKAMEFMNVTEFSLTNWIHIWHQLKNENEILNPFCFEVLCEDGCENDIEIFLQKHSIFEMQWIQQNKTKFQLCTLKLSSEFAIRLGLDWIQHPANLTKTHINKNSNISWKTAAVDSKQPPSCHLVGKISISDQIGWGDQWYDTAFHLAEALLIFKQPTVFVKSKSWLYGKKACDAEDWSCFVFPLSSCSAPNDNERRWRAGYLYFWGRKYLREGSEMHPELLNTWNTVLNDIGNGNQAAGIRGLIMMIRRWATRPQVWLRKEVAKIIPNIPKPCAVIHWRHSDLVHSRLHGRPIFNLSDMVNATIHSNHWTKEHATVVLADTEIQIKDNWIVLNRERGGLNRKYNEHLPSNNSRLEVIHLYTELVMASTCDHFTYQQGAFAGLIWDHICQTHGGWPHCMNKIHKVAMCDVCCRGKQVNKFNSEEQKCGDTQIPKYACGNINGC